MALCVFKLAPFGDVLRTDFLILERLFVDEMSHEGDVKLPRRP